MPFPFTTNCLFNTAVDLSVFGGARTHTVEKISAFAAIDRLQVSLLCAKKDNTLLSKFPCLGPPFCLFK